MAMFPIIVNDCPVMFDALCRLGYSISPGEATLTTSMRPPGAEMDAGVPDSESIPIVMGPPTKDNPVSGKGQCAPST